MRYGMIGDGLLEKVIVASPMLPSPMLEGYAMATTRALVVSVKLGLIAALADAPLPAAEVARRCGTDPRATGKLLDLLVAMGYVEVTREGAYQPSRTSRRWLLGRRSVADSVRMKELEWRWLEGLEDFVRSGEQRDVHEAMGPDEWALYQRGMRSNAGVIAPLVARRVPVPKGARDMLDIGGSHGYYSVAICRRHPGLRSTVLDLPQAVEHAAPLLAAEGMEERITLRAGDALTDDLGDEAYDLVFMASLVHHFDGETNRALMRRAAAALRPGGVLAIFEAIRLPPGQNDQVGSFFDLYFALTSRSGLWTYAEMADWQQAAGLVPRKPIRLPLSRGNGLQVADKPV
jgi:SAM-dependent methyltransferase